MERYMNFVLRRPKTIIAIIISITILLGVGIPNLKFDNTIDVMMPQQDSQYLYYEKIKKIYGNVGKFVIMNLTGDNIWTKDFFETFNNLIIDIEEYKEYNEEVEAGRLKKLESIAAEKKDISLKLLLDNFKEDPPFLRELSRTVESSIAEKNKTFNTDMILGKNDFKKIIFEIEKNIVIKKQEAVNKLISPITGKDISGLNDTLKTSDFLEKDDDGKRILPESEKDFAELRAKLLKNPAFDGGIFRKDPKTGKITDFALLIELENLKDVDTISRKIWHISESYKSINIIEQGVPIVNKQMNDYMQIDLKTFLPLVMLVIIIIFFLNFRTMKGVVLPFFTLVLADIWVMGLMGHLGFKITIVGVSLPTLMVSVGSSYAIHIVNQYYIDYDLITVKGKKNGLKLSMGHISVTILLAGLTTFLGFMSLVSNQVTGIKEWGVFSAIGVLFAVFISTSLIPAGFMLMKHKKREIIKDKKSSKTWIDSIIEVFIKISMNHYKAVIVITLILMTISIVGLTRIKVETAVMSFFSADDYIRTSSDLMAENYGGAFGTSILINSGEPDGIKDPDFLKMIDEVREWMISPENKDLHIGRTNAFTDIIKSMNRAMNNDDKDKYSIPEDKQTIVDYLEIYSGDDEDFDGRFDDFESYLDASYQTVMIFAKLRSEKGKVLSTGDQEYINHKIQKYLDKKLLKCSYKRDNEMVIRLFSESVKDKEDKKFYKSVEKVKAYLESKKVKDLNIAETTLVYRTKIDTSKIDRLENLIVDDKSSLEMIKKKNYFGNFFVKFLIAQRLKGNQSDLEELINPKAENTVVASLGKAGEEENSESQEELKKKNEKYLITAEISFKLKDKNLPLSSLLDIKGKLSKKISRDFDKEKYLVSGKTYARITGEPSIMIRLSDYIVEGQLMSLFFSLSAVFLIVILLFKNWRAGFVSLVPMGFGIIINFGIMGWFNIRLDSATAIIASITIGIGVDDTIHFLNSYRHFREKKMSRDETIQNTLRISGKAITYTSLALVFGFSVLAFSNFLPIIYFGLLVAITMVATTIGALIVLPSVIKATGVSLKESESESWFWSVFYLGKYFNLEDEV